jgi:hypothetical protein
VVFMERSPGQRLWCLRKGHQVKDWFQWKGHQVKDCGINGKVTRLKTVILMKGHHVADCGINGKVSRSNMWCQ